MVDRTEGVDPQRLRYPLLHRNLPTHMDTDDDYADAYLAEAHDEGLSIRISQNNYHMQYDSYTTDWFLQSIKQQKKGLGAYDEIKQARKEGLLALEKDKAKNVWLRDTAEGEVEKKTRELAEMVRGAPIDVRSEPATAPAAKVDEDQTMGGV